MVTHAENHGPVFAWYLNHDLPVTPINPTCTAITVAGKQHETVATLSDLKDPEETSISVITPPPVTLKTLEEAKAVGIKAVWLQPGAFDQEVEMFARENFKAVLAGVPNSQAHNGWCILVDGERGLKNAEKL